MVAVVLANGPLIPTAVHRYRHRLGLAESFSVDGYYQNYSNPLPFGVHYHPICCCAAIDATDQPEDQSVMKGYVADAYDRDLHFGLVPAASVDLVGPARHSSERAVSVCRVVML